MKKILLTILFVFSLGSINAYAETLNIVVSKQNPVASLTKDEVEKIFLSKRNTFPDGSKAIPLDHQRRSKDYVAFYKGIMNRSPEQIKSYWSRMIFTGKGQPPKEMQSDFILDVIQENPATISYMLGTVQSSKVKVVFSLEI